MHNNKTRISVCDVYDPTLRKEENNSRVSHGWSLAEYDWTEGSVHDLTTLRGISCNEYNSDHKVTDNWVRTHAIMEDFDDGSMTVSGLLSEQQDWTFDSYVYSSQNHRRDKVKSDGTVIPACDRLRTLIPLAVPIEDELTLKAVEAYFKGKYPQMDKSFMGRARYFAHGTTEVSSFINGRGPFDWRVIPGLEQLKKKVSISSWKPKTDSLITLDDIVLDRDKQPRLIKDVLPKTPIYCPFCGLSKDRGGNEHNAVIMINGLDMPCLYCSSCESREKGNGGVYNFKEVDGYIYRMELSNKLVFIDTLKSKYMGGCEEPGVEGFVCREQGGTEHVKQFCLYHEIPYPVVYPRARYELIFNSDERANFDGGYVNIYDAPELLRNPVQGGLIPKRPDMIHNVIDHVFAHDQQIIERFYNNLAWFVQTRQKMITSFLMQGVEGTGKGLLFEHVLQQIFGERFTGTADQDAFGNQFNSFLTNNVLVLVNEVSGNFSTAAGKNLSTIEKMKIAITDVNVQIEGKSKDRYNGKNVCSFLFATNRRDGITCVESDQFGSFDLNK